MIQQPEKHISSVVSVVLMSRRSVVLSSTCRLLFLKYATFPCWRWWGRMWSWFRAVLVRLWGDGRSGFPLCRATGAAVQSEGVAGFRDVCDRQSCVHCPHRSQSKYERKRSTGWGFQRFARRLFCSSLLATLLHRGISGCCVLQSIAVYFFVVFCLFVSLLNV